MEYGKVRFHLKQMELRICAKKNYLKKKVQQKRELEIR